ncbi:MAG: hypothetical protein FVQ79_03410 [Planctomycetes bacterium]|nr:hypothetical protein [Planctomycetota bacterium]
MKPSEENKEENKEENQKPKEDVFGEPVNQGGEGEGGESGTGTGTGEGGGGGGDEKKDEIEKHPLVLELRKQITDITDKYGKDIEAYGTNLSGQRDIIDKLTRKINEIAEGKKETDEKPMFEDIKRSKDLTKEQRDELTEADITQMDEIAGLKDVINKMIQDKTKETKKEEGAKPDVNKIVKATAKELAKGEDGAENIDLANQIIESAKDFNLEGLDEKAIKERVAKAAKLVPDYKPPKEQTQKKGKTVKGTTDKDDPHGVNEIVEEATGGDNDGTYKL